MKDMPAIEIHSRVSAFINRMPAAPTRRVWCEWLRRHSVDPNDVCIPGYIARDPTNRRIAYLAYDLDEKGRPRTHPHDKYDPIRVEHVVQLESVPKPFPEATP